MIRTELRRSSAPVVGLGFVVISLGMIYGLSGPWGKGSAPWNEQWIGLAQWPRNLMMFLWPLVLGAGAWQGLRDRRSRIEELLVSVPRPGWRRVAPLLGALALSLLAGYAVLLVVGGVQVAGHASYFPVSAVPVVAVLALALVATAALGVGVGRTLPSLLTPPVAAVALLALQIFTLQHNWAILLTPAFDGLDITVFTAVLPVVTGAQLLWFLGIGLTGALLATRARLAALLPVALAAGVAAPVLSNVDSPVAPDLTARELVCDGNVCVTRAHEGYLSALVVPARSALELLKKLPDPPTAVVEVMSDREFRLPPPDQVPVFADSDPTRTSSGGSTDPAVIELAVVSNGIAPPCDVMSEDWEITAGNAVARAVAAGWVTGVLRPVPGDTYLWDHERDRYERTWEAFRVLPADEQRARVIALRAAGRDCRNDLLSIVVSG